MEIKQKMSKDYVSLQAVASCHLGDTVDDSFVEELASISKSLKYLFSKTEDITELMKAVFNDTRSVDDNSSDKNCKANVYSKIEWSQKFVCDRISELNTLLPIHGYENTRVSEQTTSFILSETITYIKLLKKECDQKQAFREKIESLCMQCVTMTIRLKHLQGITNKENIPIDVDS